MKKQRSLCLMLVFLLVIMLFAGCGAAEKMDAGYDMMESATSAVNRAPEYIADNSSGSGKPDTTVNPQNQKLIRTVHLEAETENMDTLLQQMEVRVAELNGYVESRNIHNGSAYNSRRYRSASLTVRIPAADLDAFVDHVADASNITSNRETTEDVTLQYVAIESRIAALETEQARLLELLAKAENMNDLLTIESRLTDVRYELENITSQLRVYDNKVNYATIHLNISEVVEYTEPEPDNGWQRMGKGFVKSLKGLGNGIKEVFIFLVVSLPYLVVIAAIPVVIILIVKFNRKKKQRKAE